MSDNSGIPLPKVDAKTPVDGPIWPGMDEANGWATHVAQFGRGGFEIVDTIADRDLIEADRRKDKVVYVRGNDDGEPEMFAWDDLSDTWESLDVPAGWKGTGGTGGITVDDGKNSLGTVTELTVKGLRTEAGQGPGEGTLTNAVSWSTMGQGQYNGEGYKVTVESPLFVYSDPNVADGVRLGLQHGDFQKVLAPGYLAYMAEDEQVIGTDDGGVRKGKLWFGDVVWPAGSFLDVDRTNKAIGIQEFDGKDPNVSGGQDFLAVYRVALKGKADVDGMVRVGLKDKATGDWVLDVDGHPAVVQKMYKAGADLGVLEFVSVLRAKGMVYLECWVEHTLHDAVVVEDRTEGASGLMLQSIEKDQKTGPALLQFENDTGQNLRFSSHWLGPELMDSTWIAREDMAEIEGDAGKGETVASGWHFYNTTKARISVASGTITVREAADGSICYFSLGKIFSAEKTQMLRGKVLEVDVSLEDKQDAFYVYLVKWTGKPDGYGKKIITGIRNMQPIMEAGWEVVSSLFISEDVVSGVHAASKEMTVPNDADNFAIVIAPEQAESPMNLVLKKLAAGVKEPFTGYSLYEPRIDGEYALRFSERLKTLVQNRQGYASLRYTLGAGDTPMPVGELGAGNADVSLDVTVNKVAGSAARGGEGAIKFGKDGSVLVTTRLLVWPGEDIPDGGTSKASFWYSTVGPDGSLTKIDDSLVEVTLKKGGVASFVDMPVFRLSVEKGDRIALSGKADIRDGGFIECVDDSRPMVKTSLDFKELVVSGG